MELAGVYPELTNQIRHLCTEVYEFITREDRKTENEHNGVNRLYVGKGLRTIYGQ